MDSSVRAAAIDPTDFRGGQKQQWNSAATGWRKWSQTIDAGTSPVSERLVDLAGVEPGSRVLDVAAGYGEPALTAARRVGDSGSVVASDISPEMIAYGRERASAAGIANVEFLESPAAGLDFPAASFDAAVSRWGIIFEPEAEAVAARVRSFLRPGGRFAIASWGPPERVPMIALPIRVAIERLGLEPPPPGTPGPLSRPTPEAIGSILAAGGFADVAVEEVEVAVEWDSAEAFTEFNRDIVPPLRALLATQDEDARTETLAAITEAARPLCSDDGRLRLSNLALLAVGSSPSA